MSLFRVSESRKGGWKFFRVSERMWWGVSVLLAGAALGGGGRVPLETAEGVYFLPEGRVGMTRLRVRLPEELRETRLLVVDEAGSRRGFILLESGEEVYLVVDARVGEAYRVVYGFEEGIGEIPSRRVRGLRTEEVGVLVEFAGHRSLGGSRVLAEAKRPLGRLVVLLGVGLVVFMGLGVWYRRAIQ